MLRLLLLLALSSDPSDGRESLCQTQSGQMCRQNNTNPTIYKCDIEEPTRKSKEETFNEGETIEILAVGDKSGYGCSFEIKDTRKNVTCCFIHQEREEKRGKRLCGDPEQPKECRQSGRYKVEEMDGPVGWCKLTLPEASLSDAGVYKVTFPFEPVRYNQEITVKVKKVGLTQGKTLGLAFVLLLLLVVGPAGCCCFCCCLKIMLEKRKNQNQKIGDKVFNKLRKEDEEGFKEVLGNKNLLRFWDQNGNNIFHLAARSSWTERMTNIVLRGKKKDVEAPIHQYKRADIFEHLKLPAWKSKMARWYVTHINWVYWSPKLPVMIAHLNSRNEEGNTPLMIAAGQLQADMVKALVETGEVEVNLESNRWTALHKAVAACPAQKSQQSTCYNIVEYLLEKGATQNSYIHGHTPLHTAVRKNALGVVKLLVKYTGGHPVLTSTSTDGKDETALQFAVRLGEERKAIVEFLIANAGKEIDWNEFNGDCLLRAVGENNKTAVDYIFMNSLPPPDEACRTKALEVANKNMRHVEANLDNKEMKDKKRSIEHIMDKLSSAKKSKPPHEKETLADKIEKEKRKYMELLESVKEKSNEAAYDEMDEDLKLMASIHDKIQDLKRQAGKEQAGFSSTRCLEIFYSFHLQCYQNTFTCRKDVFVCPGIDTRLKKFDQEGSIN